MSQKTRKRRRSQAFPNGSNGDQDAEFTHIITANRDSNADATSGNTAADDLNEEGKEDLEGWNAFKEEHHEILDQLPLSLHRQYTLMRELDEQTQSYKAEVLDNIKQYVALRSSLARQFALDAKHSNLANEAEHADFPSQPHSISPFTSQPSSEAQQHTTVTTNMDTEQPKPEIKETCISNYLSSLQILRQIAKSSEEMLGASEEKVNLAQTAFETVDRHIRLLDQAIKEQESLISLSVHLGPNPAPLILHDLSVPRWVRPPRIEHSPIPSMSPEPLLPIRSNQCDEELILNENTSGTLKIKRKYADRKIKKLPSGKKVDTTDDSIEPAQTRSTRGVKLTLSGPTLQQVAPTEPRYCYCNQVSYGVLIGCDNPDCTLEWFHLGCTGLSEAPGRKTKWYCRDCQPKKSRQK
ncbi:hypothetical protein BJ138DRAFT_1182057 [Hygrophoropsis aurantiaca]|uniref:Uncharacterized protein n=1 Tax=Hygrophoropsis aurantiaca TaxID=72124 RepID=A0ACB8A5H9_9AGAM|nr:hypothetical protein BJ138DRAFT_1182057 [Hygrophoropsis aurantiaca]